MTIGSKPPRFFALIEDRMWAQAGGWLDKERKGCGARLRKLLIVAALGETATGLALLAYPPIAIRLLLGITVAGASVTMSRVAGISLIALGVACWPDSIALRAFYGMLTYSTSVMLFLVFLGISGEIGILLWPAVAVHAGLSLLLVWEWRRERNSPRGTHN